MTTIKSGLLAALTALALSAAIIPAATAGSIVKQQISEIDAFGNRVTKTRIVKRDEFGNRVTGVKVTRTDAFGNRVTKSRVVGTDAFGDRVVRTRTTLDPAGLGKVSTVGVTKIDAFGGVSKKRVVLTSF